MFRTFEAVLAPTIGQQAKLGRLFRLQCELYNAALEERRGVWKQNGRSVSKFEQFKGLSGFDHPVMGFGLVPAGYVDTFRSCVPGILSSCQIWGESRVSAFQTFRTLVVGRIP